MPINPVRWMSDSKDVWLEKVRDRDGKISYAIRNGYRECLNKQGVFQAEAMPSNRPDDFIEQCRWTDFDEACKALLQAEELCKRII